jgi:Short C-terminal domain
MPPRGAGGTLSDMAATTPEPAAEEPKKPAAPRTAPGSLSRGRRITVWVLVVLASILMLLSILTTWVNRQMFDNTSWNHATTKVIQDPQVQSALATYTVNQLYEHVDVAQALQQRLPGNLKRLGAPLAGALQEPATQGVKLLLERPRVQAAFITASSVAHEKLVNVLQNKTGHGISTGNGTVTLNLRELVTEVGEALGLPASALANLPANTGTITLMKSDQLGAAQAGVEAIHVLSAWLLVAVLVLYGVALYLARGKRRVTLRNIGIAFIVIGLVTLIIRRLLGNYLVNSLASPGYQVATHHLWLIGTAILGQIGAAIVLYGVIATLGALFAGPSRLATRLRRDVAPMLNEKQEIVWAVVGFVYLLAILWGGTHALRTWWGILLLAGLAALGVYSLRQQTLQEFPSGAAAEEDTAVEAHSAPAGGAAAELSRLHELHKAGAIDDAEFEQAKKIVLA